MRFGRFLLAAVALFAIGAFFVNTNLLAPRADGRPKLLAHRGLAQTYPSEGLESDTCTATRIRTPEHEFLENTIASMQAAFAAGADVVELDVHPTADGHFAVFHDWTLDCRTDGKGVTREQTLAELKRLDIGYGYTADGGKTFPFRGLGVGLMPSLDEVLAAFPDKRLLINIKSRDAAEGRMLAARLSKLPEAARARLAVFGDDVPLGALSTVLPDMRTMGRGTLKSCLLSYIGLGWSSHVPRACHGTMLLVPINYAWALWGWPHRFLARMQEAGTEVYVVGPYTGRAFTTGIDTAFDIGQLPEGYTGGIWTNRVHAIAPLVAGKR
ncbi:glycerophosphodiester phosphodiesterase family protein [Hyphomicrobium sp.]|uniref:glycerophosphodiester phosphodiesterase family protein n=1 Tax=Hyphomicrobium sp. TaxID=82 RepID=UPI0025C0611E|nr:glycerophosphodiester phosphodiesterase family protein [Hyphomicrobium sp.]MCC7253774.1 glycerophosphodiester phosphodiesterase [Hyphomicrobium sp.]